MNKSRIKNLFITFSLFLVSCIAVSNAKPFPSREVLWTIPMDKPSTPVAPRTINFGKSDVVGLAIYIARYVPDDCNTYAFEATLERLKNQVEGNIYSVVELSPMTSTQMACSSAVDKPKSRLVYSTKGPFLLFADNDKKIIVRTAPGYKILYRGIQFTGSLIPALLPSR